MGLSERSDYFRADTPAAPEPPPEVTDLGDITDLARPQFPLGTLDGATVSYRFELTERRKVGLGLRKQETDADLVVEAADGDVLGASRNAGTANEWMTITLLAGTYYVRLEAQEAGASEFIFRYGVEAAPNSPATGAPAVDGTARVGETLTVGTSGIADADRLENANFSYQWIRSDGNVNTDISGATASTHTLVDADEGKAIRVQVSFTDDAGHEETLTSAATAAVEPEPNSPATGAPAVDGTARVGETLTAGNSGIADADGLDNATFTYQWVASDGTTDTDISGETASTYTLVASDEGKTVKVTVSFTDDAGNAETLSSAATGAVAARPNSPATGVPAIGGTAQVGETLTADTTGIADADGLTGATLTYQWIANDGAADADIVGGTDAAYLLQADEEGKTIKVKVSFTDDAGNEETLDSAPTEVVVAAEATEPPSRPQGLTGTAAHDAVSLIWDDPGDATITAIRYCAATARCTASETSSFTLTTRAAPSHPTLTGACPPTAATSIVSRRATLRVSASAATTSERIRRPRRRRTTRPRARPTSAA